MRTALFASGGDIPIAALRALHEVSEVAVIVRPAPTRGIAAGLRRLARRLVRGAAPADELSVLAETLGVPELPVRSPSDTALAPRLRTLGIDLACVATYPWRLRPDVLSVASRGTVNVHGSILPRHRGPTPLFWTYWADDQRAGVTIHVCDERYDAGPILRQRAWPLARGYPVVSLHEDVARHGAKLLREVVVAMTHGDVPPTPQDPTAVTAEGHVRPGVSMVDRAWPAERVWHFLAGLAGRFTEPLRCAGERVKYTRVPEYLCQQPAHPPGTIEAMAPHRAWRLWCPDGFVRLESR